MLNLQIVKVKKIIDEIYKIATPGVSIEPSGRH